jgi:hypothetical protein
VRKLSHFFRVSLNFSSYVAKKVSHRKAKPYSRRFASSPVKDGQPPGERTPTRLLKDKGRISHLDSLSLLPALPFPFVDCSPSPSRSRTDSSSSALARSAPAVFTAYSQTSVKFEPLSNHPTDCLQPTGQPATITEHPQGSLSIQSWVAQMAQKGPGREIDTTSLPEDPSHVISILSQTAAHPLLRGQWIIIAAQYRRMQKICASIAVMTAMVDGK